MASCLYHPDYGLINHLLHWDVIPRSFVDVNGFVVRDGVVRDGVVRMVL
jgi:hypothetical protein